MSLPAATNFYSPPSSDLIDSKIKELNDVVNEYRNQLLNFSTFSQRHLAFTYVYEQNTVVLEKTISDYNLRHQVHLRKLKNECQKLFAHVVQLTRKH